MSIYSTTATGAQDGYAIAGAWNEGTTTLLQSDFHTVGLQFVLHTDFDSQGTPLDPALVYPSFILTLHIAQMLAAGTVDISIVPEAAPQPYSNTLLPGARGETALLSVDVAFTDTTVVATVPTLLMVPYFRDSNWNGIVSLTLATTDIGILNALSYHSAEGVTPALAPSINATEVPFHTGRSGFSGVESRLGHCPKSGLVMPREEMVPDGYLRGTLVAPRHWDPPDTVGRRRIRRERRELNERG